MPVVRHYDNVYAIEFGSTDSGGDRLRLCIERVPNQLGNPRNGLRRTGETVELIGIDLDNEPLAHAWSSTRGVLGLRVSLSRGRPCCEQALQCNFGHENASADAHRGDLPSLYRFVRERSADAQKLSSLLDGEDEPVLDSGNGTRRCF